MFWRGSYTSVIPYALAISGISCMRPFAPASLVALALNRLSVYMSFLMSSSGMLYIFEASLMISLMYDGTVTGSALRCGENMRLRRDWAPIGSPKTCPAAPLFD